MRLGFFFLLVPNLFENLIMKKKIPFKNYISLSARCRDGFYFLANLYILDTKLNELNYTI